MNSMFANILSPVDFSQRCIDTAPQVAAIARRFKSKITLLHAIGDYTSVFTPDAPSSFAWREWLMKDTEPRIAFFGKSLLDEFVVERLVLDGEAAAVIRDYAANNPTDLITLPTHGRGMFRRFLLGSVTTKVLHDCKCPIWTTAHDLPPSVEDVHTILCALDLSEPCEEFFEAARKIACGWGAELRLIHAVPVPGAPQESMMNREFADFLVDRANQQIADLQKQFGTAYAASVATGDIAGVIHDAAKECNAGLVIVGRGHLRGHLGTFRTNVTTVIREAPCPVLSL